MITLKRNKGSALSHDELDDNFAGSVNLFDTQTVGGVKTFTSSPVVPTPAPLDNSTKVATTAYVEAAVSASSSGGNFVTLDTPQTITGQKTFTQQIKSDGIVSILNSNGGAYVDVNDGNINIGTGLNSASGVPEISITNVGYGMAVIFNPSSGTQFETGVSIRDLSAYNSTGLSGIISLNATSTNDDLVISSNPRRVIISSVQTMFTGINSNNNGSVYMKGLMDGLDSWSSDWDDNSIVNILERTHFEKIVSGNIIITFKDVSSCFSYWQVLSGTTAATKKITFALTGATDKVTWPSFIKWPNGVKPTFSTGTDIIEMILVIGTAGVKSGYGYVIASNMS